MKRRASVWTRGCLTQIDKFPMFDMKLLSTLLWWPPHVPFPSCPFMLFPAIASFSRYMMCHFIVAGLQLGLQISTYFMYCYYLNFIYLLSLWIVLPILVNGIQRASNFQCRYQLNFQSSSIDTIDSFKRIISRSKSREHIL